MVACHGKSYTDLQKGFMIIEAIIVISVLISMISLGASYVTRQAECTANQTTAQQLLQITKAAQYYVQDHYQDFKNNPKKEITFDELTNNGYLSSQISPTNIYGQSHFFTVIKEENKELLQLVVTTEKGISINEKSLRQIVSLTNGSGGYASVLHPNKITGYHDNWSLQGIPLQIGHLASFSVINEKDVMDANTFLRRTKIDSHPEYNTMNTDLLIENSNIFLTSHHNNDMIKIGAGNLSIKNDEQTWSSEFTPAAIRLESQQSGNKSYLGNDYIEIKNNSSNSTYLSPGNLSIKNDEQTRSSEFTPAAIRLESQQSGHKSYLGNDYIEVKNMNNDKVYLSEKGLWLNDVAVATDKFVTAGFHEVSDVDNDRELQRVADSIDCSNHEGRLFMVGDYSPTLKKKLLMCIWHSGPTFRSYLIVAQGSPQRF